MNQDGDAQGAADAVPCAGYGAFEEWLVNVGQGWYPLLAEAHRRVSEVWPGYGVFQVKKKFGGLRIYLEHPDNTELSDRGLRRCWSITNELEKRSLLTCEFCGQPGVRREGGWIKTLCDGCSGGAPASALRSMRLGNLTWHWFESAQEGTGDEPG